MEVKSGGVYTGKKGKHQNGDNMKIVIIHGQSHKGSTYHIAHMLAEKLEGEIKEFFLPRDFGEFCVGCTRCILESEKKCPHYEKLKPLTAAIDEADVVILGSPVYVYHAAGSMKAFLDHYGYRWMVHCPEESIVYDTLKLPEKSVRIP